MEKFYRVPEGTGLHETFKAWEGCDKRLCKIAGEVMRENEMETTKFVPNHGRFGIVPTNKDLEKFGAQLCKNDRGGVRFFKKNSAVNKEWMKKTSSVKITHKPFLPCHFSGAIGHTRTRLFQIDGVVYCSMDCEAKNWAPLEPLKEIKASEFWRIIEDYEERTGRK